MKLFVLLLASCFCLSFHNYGVEANNFETICVDMYKQPAFDHPALKNHEIQMNPSFLAKSEHKKINVSSSMGEKWQESGFKNVITCPSGKVPIQRPTKNSDNKIVPNEVIGRNDYAKYGNADREVYKGVKAVMELRNPNVEADQYSFTEITINGRSTDPEIFNSLIVGWSVNPVLYGDNKTRATARWQVTEGGKIKGCYNLVCPGFVQMDPTIHLGLEYKSTTLPGRTHYFTSFMIFQDKMSDNWWLLTGNDNKPIGYWPKELVPVMSREATEVRYGAVTRASKAGVSPPMGSGEFASRDYERSCRFTDLLAMDQNFKLKYMSAKDMVTILPHPNCYGLVDLGGPTFSFGGPGGKCL